MDMTPDTNLALLQAGQSDTGKASKALERATKGNDMKAIEDAALEFEAVFIAEMMKPMFSGISTEAPFGGGKGEEIFRGMLLQEYGKLVSQTGGIGIADHVKQHMIQVQGQQQTGPIEQTASTLNTDIENGVIETDG